MKKVWILEKFVDDVEMAVHLIEIKELNDEMRKQITDEVELEKLDKMVENYENKMKENPKGYWSGWEGKAIYKSFCDVAKAAIKRNPYAKYRVVEAEVKDDAKMWLDYTVVKVNEGVLRYLMATYNK